MSKPTELYEHDYNDVCIVCVCVCGVCVCVRACCSQLVVLYLQLLIVKHKAAGAQEERYFVAWKT